MLFVILMIMNNRIHRSRFFKQSFQSWKQAGLFQALISKMELRYVSLLEGNPYEIVHSIRTDEIQFIFEFNDVFGQGDFLLEYLSEMVKKEGFSIYQSHTFKQASENFGFELMERMVLNRSKWKWIPWVSFKDAETLIFTLSVGHQKGRLSIKHQSKLKEPRFKNALNTVAWLLEKQSEKSIKFRFVK